jgi:hypothetical protein
MTQGKIEIDKNGKNENSEVDSRSGSNLFFENLEWLTTAEAAVYLRKFCPTGTPSVNAVHKLVSQGKIRRRKFSGRLFFKRKELDYLIECSEA